MNLTKEDQLITNEESEFMTKRVNAYQKPEIKSIYLAGAINGCSDAVCNDWRQYVRDKLGQQYDYLDPMRRDYRGKELENIKNIIEGDKDDIFDAKIFLGNANLPSWGTAMEIFYAFNLGNKEVVLICDKEKPSPWLVGHSHKIFKTLDEAIGYLRGIK